MEHVIEITIDDVNPVIAPELRAYAGRRFAFALRRFDQQVRRVRLRLTDVNGPRRGLDARCAATVDLINGQQLFVEAVTAWPFRSVTKAAAQVSEAVRRELRAGRERARAARSRTERFTM